MNLLKELLTYLNDDFGNYLYLTPLLNKLKIDELDKQLHNILKMCEDAGYIEVEAPDLTKPLLSLWGFDLRWNPIIISRSIDYRLKYLLTLKGSTYLQSLL